MNNATLGNSSLLPFCDKLFPTDFAKIPILVTVIIRLPVSIYILLLILSRRLITSEFYTLNVEIFEILIGLYDILGLVAYFNQTLHACLVRIIRRYLLGFMITGHPCLLTLVCVERYLAVVKPAVFLELKALKYKVAMSGFIWLWTLASCLNITFMVSGFRYFLTVQLMMCCAIKFCCCVATLLVLKQPAPGGGLRQREGMSSSKLKAFRIILTVTTSVIIMYVPIVVLIIFQDYLTYQQFSDIINVFYACTAFSGFLQAFWFFQRFSKLPFIKRP